VLLKKFKYATELAGMSPVLMSETITRMDAGDEPTGMYSRRVSDTNTGLMPNPEYSKVEEKT
jgi:hypothetical protein